MIHEEFKQGKPIIVTSRLIKIYDSMKKLLNERKNKNRSLNNDNGNNYDNIILDNEMINQDQIQVDQNNENIQEINEVNSQGIEHISELLEKSCIMESEDEGKKDESKMRERLAKKTSYKIMTQNHNDSNPYIEQKFKKTQINK